MRAKWNDELIKILVDNFSTKSMSEMMALLPQFTKEQIRNKAKRYNLKKEVYEIHIWSEEEDKFLLENYSDMTAGEIGKHLGLNISQVRNRANKLNIKKQNKWSENDEKLIMEKFDEIPIEKLSELLESKRESKAIIKKAKELGVAQVESRANWSEDDELLLKQFFAIKTNLELQQEFFPYYTIAQIKCKARGLGLKKTNMAKYKANLKAKENLVTTWKDDEKRILIEHYGKMNNKILQREYLPHKTIEAIKKQAGKLNLNNKTYQYFIWKNVDVKLDEEDSETICFTFEKDLVV